MENLEAKDRNSVYGTILLTHRNMYVLVNKLNGKFKLSLYLDEKIFEYNHSLDNEDELVKESLEELRGRFSLGDDEFDAIKTGKSIEITEQRFKDYEPFLSIDIEKLKKGNNNA